MENDILTIQGSATPNNQSESDAASFNPATIQEFTPQATAAEVLGTFSMSSLNSAIPPTQYNHVYPSYSEGESVVNGNIFYPAQPTFGAPQQHVSFQRFLIPFCLTIEILRLPGPQDVALHSSLSSGLSELGPFKKFVAGALTH